MLGDYIGEAFIRRVRLCGWYYAAMPALAHLSRAQRFRAGTKADRPVCRRACAPDGLQFRGPCLANDQRIASLTGQVFSDAYRLRLLDHRNGVFDSVPATRGIVAGGQTDRAAGQTILQALQKARYVDGRNTAKRAVVAAVLADAAFAEAADRLQAPDDRLLHAYQEPIRDGRAEMARFALDGVSALLVDMKPGARCCRAGCCSATARPLVKRSRRCDGWPAAEWRLM